ncbi:MAG: pantothenate kinase [Sulfurovum sp.]|nr:MAG: pantothenate kinase [Sulfurovum sp.]
MAIAPTVKGKILLLADIGNTYFHIYNGECIEHLSYKDAIDRYSHQALFYISVQKHLEEKIEKIKAWENISEKIYLQGTYDTMGIDRQALCLSHKNGVFVDAGSAITVDIVEKGMYQGGFILPGLKAYLGSYAAISPVLEMTLNKELKLDALPLTTKDGISYGIIASIKALIDKHHTNKKLYFTGGDGEFLSTFFEEATYDEMLIFDGMQNALRAN